MKLQLVNKNVLPRIKLNNKTFRVTGPPALPMQQQTNCAKLTQPNIPVPNAQLHNVLWPALLLFPFPIATIASDR